MSERPPETLGYVRASRKKQENSPEQQRATIDRYAAAFDLGEVKFYNDPAKSGRRLDLAERPAGKALLDRARAGDTIIVTKLDRMFRRTRDALATVEALRDRGVALHILNFGGASINTGSPIGKLFLTMMAGYAEFEADMISERTREGLADRKRRDVRHSRHAGYGFKWVREKDSETGKPKLVRAPNPAEREVMGQIVKWRMSSPAYSWEVICDNLRKHKILTPEGKPWTISRIRRACHAEHVLQAREGVKP